MKKSCAIICLVVTLTAMIIPVLLTANEVDDFRFAVGLYSDGNYPLAKSELEKFIRNYSDSPFIDNARFLLANIFLNENNYTEAKKHFETLHRSNLEPLIRPEVILGLAQCYFFTESYNNSRRLLLDFNRDFKSHRLAWKSNYFLGRIEYLSTNYELSLRYLNRAKELNPDWTVRIARLQTLIELSMYQDAEVSIFKHTEANVHNEYIYQMIVIYLNHSLKAKQYQKVTTFASSYIPETSLYSDDYLLVLSEANVELGNYQEALANLQKMKTKPERAEYITALSYMRTGQDGNAERLFTELSKNARNIEIKSNSYFFLATLKGKNDLSETNRMLVQFLRENQGHPFSGAANYQLGINYFSQEKYGDAVTYLTAALSAGIDEELTEKARYIIAESYFQLQYSQEAINWFNSYLDTYPKGVYADEVLFKSGLHYFRQKDLPNALVRFDRLINEFPGSDRIAMAHFYQGEIFTAGNQYDIAFGKYQSALTDFADKGLIWLRIAQINFHLGKYDETLNNLQNVPDTQTFIFEKQTIKGNAHFAKKDYLTALRAFEAALKAAETQTATEDALIRQARTLYQLKEYREALAIYRRLLQMNPQEQYVLSAAAVSFTAQDYRAAITFYQRYLDEYPEGREVHRVQLNLADSYYNLQEYERAASHYQKLIRPNIDRSVLANSLNGLEWSAMQSDNIDFELIVNNSLQTDSPIYFRILLNSRLVNYFYDKQRWEDTVNTVRMILQLAPREYNTEDLELTMAKALTKLRMYTQAEETYRKLHGKQPKANVLYHWAELHLIQQDSLAAVNRLRQASELTRESNIWLELLKLGVATKNPGFLIDYEKYLSFARNVEREQAQLLWIRWHLKRGNLDTVEPIITSLLQSSYEPIKARAQYLKGVHLYQSGKISEAIPELLRVRYLYPRIEDVRLDAELLACHAYLDINDRDNALRLFDTIRTSLPQSERDRLRRRLGLEG